MMLYNFNYDMVNGLILFFSLLIFTGGSLFTNILMILMSIMLLITSTAYLYNLLFLCLLLGIMYVGGMMLFFSYSIMLSGLKSTLSINFSTFYLLLFLLLLFFFNNYFFFGNNNLDMLDVYFFTFSLFFLGMVIILGVLFNCVSLCLEKHY
uniref:NADH dehydrogenase subunit 6 n=1 Tax=Clavelina oblonga TaxID=286222 RepID=A0A024FSM5_9ASCI|nr:NADH dehydrogenase subunit 6 [Clavelina oblonga]CAL24390.1 NADH dehydrogenase subunit 6 [Clavelina oblonga]